MVSGNCNFVMKALDTCSLGILKNTVNLDVEVAQCVNALGSKPKDLSLMQCTTW